MFCVFLLSLLSCAPKPATTANVTSVTTQAQAPAGYQNLLMAVNQARQRGHDCGSAGRFGPAPALSWQVQLADAARAHSLDMLNDQFFGHVGSDGVDVGVRTTRAGYNWRLVGENLAYSSPGFYTQASVVAAWLESPGHCANLMNPGFEQMGAAKVEGEFDFWTQVLAAPD